VPLPAARTLLASLPPGPPERYGRYQLVEQIGRGGMADVFRAVTEGIEGFRRTFVIKRIRAEKSDSAELIRMFCDEARISALLDHPNIVQVYDFGQIDGSYFMAMEYLRGRDLASVMRAVRAARTALTPPLAAFIAREVALGLHHAHTAVLPGGGAGRIVHRDVTPSNIMLLRAGGVKILDFGIASAAALASDRQRRRVKGKLAYFSPEQASAGELDARSDVFALGVVLWEMVTGRRLFTGESDLGTIRNVLSAPVPAPSSLASEVPAALDQIVARALSRERDGRYPSAEDMADALERFLVEHPCSRREVPGLLTQLFGEDLGEDLGEGLAETVADAGGVAGAQADAPVAGAARAEGASPRPRWGRGRLVTILAAATLLGCFGWAARARLRAPRPAAAPVDQAR
jgi:eukaryotic-like serine/threonine-protein kinase